MIIRYSFIPFHWVENVIIMSGSWKANLNVVVLFCGTMTVIQDIFCLLLVLQFFHFCIMYHEYWMTLYIYVWLEWYIFFSIQLASRLRLFKLLIYILYTHPYTYVYILFHDYIFNALQVWKKRWWSIHQCHIVSSRGIARVWVGHWTLG